jgi:hypothetical protein
MKTFVIGSLLAMIAAGAAMAGETGVINQAGPYEATMQFYLHPAQGFAGKPEAAQPSSASTSSDESKTESKQTVTRLASRSHRSLSIKTGYGSQSPTR